jgi:hypothetical protein
MAVAKRRRKRYTGTLQFFHNAEHDPTGRNHCKSAGKYPYRIEHINGKHKISGRVAIGHGVANRPQKFRFTKRLGNGWDMTSGIKVD